MRVGGQVRDTGLDVHSAWQGLAEAYRTPDAGALLTVMVPVRDRAANLGEQAQRVGRALLEHAAEAGAFARRLDVCASRPRAWPTPRPAPPRSSKPPPTPRDAWAGR